MVLTGLSGPCREFALSREGSGQTYRLHIIVPAWYCDTKGLGVQRRLPTQPCLQIHSLHLHSACPTLLSSRDLYCCLPAQVTSHLGLCENLPIGPACPSSPSPTPRHTMNSLKWKKVISLTLQVIKWPPCLPGIKPAILTVVFKMRGTPLPLTISFHFTTLWSQHSAGYQVSVRSQAPPFGLEHTATMAPLLFIHLLI